jgi:hypothetical protein
VVIDCVMELLGFLQQLASWQFLAVVALMDAVFILIHLTHPNPHSLPSLLPTPHPSSSSSFAADYEHAKLLEKVMAERERVAEEMRRTVVEMRELSKSMKQRARVLDDLDSSIGRLERTIGQLQEAEEEEEEEEEKSGGSSDGDESLKPALHQQQQQSSRSNYKSNSVDSDIGVS